jgi:putative glutamine amidotransferase
LLISPAFIRAEADECLDGAIMKILLSVKDKEMKRGLDSPYAKALMAAGAKPDEIELAAPAHPPRLSLESYDGFLFAGGEDVDPEFYGEAPKFDTVRTDRARDEFEFKLLDWATHHRHPVLGICRGAQMINVRFNGTLFQDLKAEAALEVNHQQIAPRQEATHGVTLTDPESKLASVFQGSCRVNSMHHQAIRRLGRGLKVTARSEDGLVEALEGAGDGPWLMAVQWHPEEIVDRPEQRKLFELFLTHCRERAQQRHSQAHA